MFIRAIPKEFLIFRIAKRAEPCIISSMKQLIGLLCISALLTSCNTTIGVGRDLKEGYQWSKAKIQESRQQDSYDQGPPVY